MYGGVEGEPEPRLVHAQEILPEQEVSGTRYRQELREPLNHAQKQGFEEFDQAP